MFKVTKYKNVKSSKVEAVLDIEDVLGVIKNGDSALKHIKYARSFNKAEADYDSIKTNLIPTFRFNFLFEGKASNNNIIEPTGLIFIDVDDTTEITESDFVFAKWKSISLTGFSILVKVDNLTKENFNDSYNKISSLLKVDSDTGARKLTQQTVQSYDPNIYINHDSKTYNCINIKKVSSPIKQKKGRECLTTYETFVEDYQHIKVRFNNIDDYFKEDDSRFIVFENDKERLCIPYVPFKVKKGNRNKILFIYLTQIVALNPTLSKAYIKILGESINSNVMKPQLPENELINTVNSIFKLKESDGLIIIYNKERRILFNPNYKISFKDKMIIVNKELGEIAKGRTTEKIYECIEEWDFESNGKITQKSVAILVGVSLSTVKRYWDNFKSFIKELNGDFKIKKIKC